MKIDIELFIGNQSTEINFWNYLTGKDVNCDIVNGKIFQKVKDEVGEWDGITFKELTLTEWVTLVSFTFKKSLGEIIQL